MARLLLAMIAAATSLLTGASGQRGILQPAHASVSGAAATADLPQPPIADPQQLVAAYYQALAAAVNSGNFDTLVAFFTADAGIDSDLVPGGASGTAEILAFFKKLPSMSGFTVEMSNLVEADPYVDVDWRFRAAPGSMRGYLDGHDGFTVRDGLISQLSQQVDREAAAEAFLPPPSAPAPRGTPVERTNVRIESFQFMPAVIKVPVGGRVTWTNADADSHTVTTDDKAIDSGVIEEDVSVTLSFPVAREYPYYCTIHPGMRGKVVVGP